jgi:hypothetical protein
MFAGATFQNSVVVGVAEQGSLVSYQGMRGEEPRHSETGVSHEVIGKAIKQVQDMFWGQSSYAVVFCVLRDLYGFGDNASQFEAIVGGLQQQLGFSYACPPNTIASSFYNNSYLKLNVSKWEQQNVKPRCLRLVKAFDKAVEEELGVRS